MIITINLKNKSEKLEFVKDLIWSIKKKFNTGESLFIQSTGDTNKESVYYGVTPFQKGEGKGFESFLCAFNHKTLKSGNTK